MCKEPEIWSCALGCYGFPKMARNIKTQIKSHFIYKYEIPCTIFRFRPFLCQDIFLIYAYFFVRFSFIILAISAIFGPISKCWVSKSMYSKWEIQWWYFQTLPACTCMHFSCKFHKISCNFGYFSHFCANFHMLGIKMHVLGLRN